MATGLQVNAGRYVLQQKPREGGMAKVYAARNMQDDGKKVAVKLFEAGRLENEIVQDAFAREVRALKQLQHPSIVQLLDWEIDDTSSFPYVVLEWCELDLSKCMLESEG
jgi:serine/threonine protein kinase